MSRQKNSILINEHALNCEPVPLIPLTAAGLAQSVDRLTAERVVAGSIPGAGPKLTVLK